MFCNYFAASIFVCLFLLKWNPLIALWSLVYIKVNHTCTLTKLASQTDVSRLVLFEKIRWKKSLSFPLAFLVAIPFTEAASDGGLPSCAGAGSSVVPLWRKCPWNASRGGEHPTTALAEGVRLKCPWSGLSDWGCCGLLVWFCFVLPTCLAVFNTVRNKTSLAAFS